MNGSLISDRLAKIEETILQKGAHEDFNNGMCVMEAVSFVAGEPWSDSPSCASHVIASFIQSWNDALDDEARNRLLKPLVPLLVGTAGSREIEERRSYMALDWLVRVFTPTWLDLVPALHEHAKALRESGPIANIESAETAGKQTRAAGAAAGAAAWAAAWAAARDARDAAGAAAGAAAWAAAWEAARDAAGAAARDALKPTTERLQASALALVHQMIEVTA